MWPAISGSIGSIQGVYGRNLSDEREVIGGFVVDAFGSTDVPFTEPRRWFVSVKYTGGGGS